MSAHVQANIIAILGGSGSGKTWRGLNVHLKKRPPRLAIFDMKCDDKNFGQVAKLVTASQFMEALKQPRFAVRYHPNYSKPMRDQFDWFCGLCYHYGNMAVWGEELRQVTSPSSSPPNWAKVTMMGREYTRNGKAMHLDVIGTSQRPASIDKDFFSNCTIIECGVLEDKNDLRTMSNTLRCSVTDLQTLRPGQFIRRERGQKEFSIVGKPI